jgi:hypothetical protein
VGKILGGENPTPFPRASVGGRKRTLYLTLCRVGRVWLALELGAGILALALLAALLPLVVVAFPAYLGRPIPFWAVAVDVLALSVPLAVLLGAAAMRVPKEVARA